MSSYLQAHCLEAYLTDIVTLLIETRDEQPLQFISE